MYEFASSSATLPTVYTAVMHTRRMNVIPEAELWNYDRLQNSIIKHCIDKRILSAETIHKRYMICVCGRRQYLE